MRYWTTDANELMRVLLFVENNMADDADDLHSTERTNKNKIISHSPSRVRVTAARGWRAILFYFLFLFTLNEALLMLTLLPRLVSVHLMRINTWRWRFCSPFFN